MSTTTRICFVACIVAIALTAFASFVYGDPATVEHKITFSQVSTTPGGGFAADDEVAIGYPSLVQFVADGQTARNPGSVAYAGKSTTPERHFRGWYEFNAANDNPYDFTQPVTGAVNLFARFTEDSLVTFLNGFGESFLTKHVGPNATVSEPTDSEMSLFTAPAGMRFDDTVGWKSQGAVYDFDTPVTEDLTLSPTLAEGVSVYFVSEGSQVPFQTFETHGTATEPNAPTRPGYTFDHWAIAKGGTTPFNFATAIDEDTRLYAVWTPLSVNYTVVVWMEKKGIVGDTGTDLGNYEYFGKFTQSAMAGAATSTFVTNAPSLVAASSVTVPAWSGYGFTRCTSDTVLGNGTTVLNVYYKRTLYTFSFTPYDTTNSSTSKATLSVGSQTYTNASRYSFAAKYEQDVAAVWPVSPLATLSAPGTQLNFQGWKASGVTTVFVSKVITISTDLLPKSGTQQTLTANWLTTGMTINLNYMFETIDGKNTPGAVQYGQKYYVRDETYSQTAFSSGAPFALKEIKGMKALTSNALQKTASGFSVPTAKTLADQYLFYDRLSFTLSFDTQGGNSVPDITGLYAGTALASKKPADPVRTDGGSQWVFDGWYTSPSDDMTRFDFATEVMPDANVRLYAKWTQDPYTISVYDGLANATLLGTYTRAQGEYVDNPQIALAAVGVTVNYTEGTIYPSKGEFQGWVIPLGPGETTPLSPELPVTEDLSVYADWKPQTFTVTYLGGEASGTAPIDRSSYERATEARVLDPSTNGSLVAPADTEFTGWTDANGHLYYPGETLTITGDVVLTATYTTPDKFVVYTYHVNYPADAEDAQGQPFTDPGNIRQYVGQGQKFSLLGYDAYRPTPEPEGYQFEGWAESQADANAGTVAYAGGESIETPTSSALRIDCNLWAVWVKYLPVTFDADSPYGNLSSGSASAVYEVPSGGNLQTNLGFSAVPEVTPTPGYTFTGWALENEYPSTVPVQGDILTNPVNTAVTYKAVYAGTDTPPSATYFGVTFDADRFGNLGSSGKTVTYQVLSGTSLAQIDLSQTPTITPNTGYEFTGWALENEYPTTVPVQSTILTNPVNTAVTYKAVYAGISTSNPSDTYLGVTFDAGGIYGTIDSGANAVPSVTLAIKKGDSLSETPGFAIPSVETTTNPDISFVGWSPVVNVTSPVEEVRLYTAQYAYTPGGIIQKSYSVRFEIGAQGAYINTPLTSYAVPEGDSLDDLEDAGGNPLFAASNFLSSNIVTAKDFVFLGWSPVVDSALPVYANRVYQAQYAYEPEGISVIDYTPLVVTNDPPNAETLRAQGYDGYYDGEPHGIRYDVSESTWLTGVLSFWRNPDESPEQPETRLWVPGLPPTETNVGNKEFSLVFTADGKLPPEAEPTTTRSIVIRPRPLVPQATHGEITVGTEVPLRSSYSLAMSYNGKKQDGDPIGDSFSFAAHQKEFANSAVPLSTTYQKGDPAGTYPIYAKAGTYGNYEIYEGTEGNWPYFAGWRFAGVFSVKAPASNDDKKNNPEGDTSTGKKTMPKTGDESLALLWLGLLLVAVTLGTAAVSKSTEQRL
ncbi:MAG: InlB B-repeat-containing protein [Actinomycetes bacterium]|jgi:uncharacterized repeat protein (TIGR02543 family)|nr:InlB B-repeat-containing protein [Actinomycetes bacterium]